MNSASLEQLLKHDGRLNLLYTLSTYGPLSARELAIRIGESEPAVRYWLRLLVSVDLVDAQADSDEAELVYVLTLDGQPEWVRATLTGHRPRTI